MLIIHGFVHFIGFAKPLNVEICHSLPEISKPTGSLWMFAGLHFVISPSYFYVLDKDNWPILTIVAVVVSQILIYAVREVSEII